MIRNGLRHARMIPALGCLALVAALAASCGGPTSYATYEDDGKTITIPHPSQLVVTLDANPGSEYLWVLDKLNQGVLLFKTKELVTLDEESKFGGHKFRRFTFDTVGPGTTTMEIEFSSLFEDDDEGDDIDTYVLTVVVE